MDYLISTKRLLFRKIKREDLLPISAILKDEEVMYAWEHGFSDSEVSEWIDKNLERYKKDGFSYFAVLLKDTNELIGVMGPIIEDIQGVLSMGIAYIFNKKYWGNGYASEGAKAVVQYAFEFLGANRVIAEIRPCNHASIKVATSIGMTACGEFIKIYNGKEMPHLIYEIRK